MVRGPVGPKGADGPRQWPDPYLTGGGGRRGARTPPHPNEGALSLSARSHFRHEISGHYFWDVLVRDGGRLDDCRAVFGDDSQDYNTALQAHYQNGAPADRREHFVSAYATSHPWEDWAETWAHYLHIVDTLEMASAFGVRVQPRVTRDETLSAEIDIDPYEAIDMTEIIDAWLPLTFAMNRLNRAMGNHDLYPFVLSPRVIEKLTFVHEIAHLNI